MREFVGLEFRLDAFRAHFFRFRFKVLVDGLLVDLGFGLGLGSKKLNPSTPIATPASLPPPAF